MDYIAFTQDELYRAIDMGYSVIALCDNTFLTPRNKNIKYIKIGDVNISEYDDEPKTNVTPCVMDTACSFGASFNSSYSSSYAYSYRTSYSYSYSGSYLTSYKTSFVSSFGMQYVPAGSFSGEGFSFREVFLPEFHRIKEISVNGYGINLI